MTDTMTSPDKQRLQDIAADLIERAIKAGADAAEASVSESRNTELSVRDVSGCGEVGRRCCSGVSQPKSC